MGGDLTNREYAWQRFWVRFLAGQSCVYCSHNTDGPSFYSSRTFEVGECGDNHTPRGTITAPTRREVLVRLGTLAIGIAAGATRSAPHSSWPIWSVEGAGGHGYLVGETYPRPADWDDRGIEALVPGCSMLWTETKSDNPGRSERSSHAQRNR
jgi:hypothetical protein